MVSEDVNSRGKSFSSSSYFSYSSSSFVKIISVWKMLMLFVVTVSGICILLTGFNHRVYDYSLRLDPLLQVWSNDNFCSQRLIKPTAPFLQHYPKPHTYAREECGCTPVHYFVLLSTQRSGSGWFETLLNSHPNISSNGEIFTVKPRRQNFTTIANTLDIVFNLDWQSSSAKNSCTAAVGLKWMLNQGALEYSSDVAAYFKRRGVSVILLLRRNGLKRLISIMANAYDRQKPLSGGTHVSHVHSQEQAEILASYKPTIDLKTLYQDLLRYQRLVDDALAAFKNTRLLVIYYEDLVKDALKLQREAQEFLGVEVRSLESQQVKIHKGPLAGSISNWKEVFQELNGTQFHSFLADDDYK